MDEENNTLVVGNGWKRHQPLVEKKQQKKQCLCGVG